MKILNRLIMKNFLRTPLIANGAFGRAEEKRREAHAIQDASAVRERVIRATFKCDLKAIGTLIGARGGPRRAGTRPTSLKI
jgi:hypothetical protein